MVKDYYHVDALQNNLALPPGDSRRMRYKALLVFKINPNIVRSNSFGIVVTGKCNFLTNGVQGERELTQSGFEGSHVEAVISKAVLERKAITKEAIMPHEVTIYKATFSYLGQHGNPRELSLTEISKDANGESYLVAHHTTYTKSKNKDGYYERDVRAWSVMHPQSQLQTDYDFLGSISRMPMTSDMPEYEKKWLR